MAKIDAGALATAAGKAFLKAAGPGGKAAWSQAKKHVIELANIAAAIEAQKLADEITESGAALLMDNQKTLLEMVAGAAQGEAEVALEEGINAALGVIYAAIKAATGFDLSGT